MDKYITIATYHTTSEANECKEKLKIKGIQSFISEGHALLEPLSQNSNENVRVNINEKDYQIAKEVLDL
jgi:hypothetical protein